MPITTRKALHGNIRPAVKYITQDYKTNNQTLVSALNCGVATAAEEMEMTERKFHKNSNKNNRTGYHIIQSFSIDDDISFDTAHEIGEKLVKELYPDYQAIVATHVDRMHVHNHIIMSSINMETGKKLDDSLSDKEGSLYKLRHKSNEIAEQYGCKTSEEVPITSYKKRNYAYKPIVLKDTIKGLINHLLTIVKSLKEFIRELLSRNFEVKVKKEISIKPPNVNAFIRLDKLDNGSYSKENLEKYFELGAPVFNGEPLLKYFDTNSKNSFVKEKEKKINRDLYNTFRTKERSFINDLTKIKSSMLFENINNEKNSFELVQNNNDFLDIEDTFFLESLNKKIKNNQKVQESNEDKNKEFLLVDEQDNEIFIPIKNSMINKNKIKFEFLDKEIDLHNELEPFNTVKDYSYLKLDYKNPDEKNIVNKINELYLNTTGKTIFDYQVDIKNILLKSNTLKTMQNKIEQLKNKIQKDSAHLQKEVPKNRLIDTAKLNYLRISEKEILNYILQNNVSSRKDIGIHNYNLVVEQKESIQKERENKEDLLNYLNIKKHINEYLKVKNIESIINKCDNLDEKAKENILDNAYKDEYFQYKNARNTLKKDFENELLIDYSSEKSFDKNLKTLASICSQRIKDINKEIAIFNRKNKNNNLLNETLLMINDVLDYEDYTNKQNKLIKNKKILVSTNGFVNLKCVNYKPLLCVKDNNENYSHLIPIEDVIFDKKNYFENEINKYNEFKTAKPKRKSNVFESKMFEDNEVNFDENDFVDFDKLENLYSEKLNYEYSDSDVSNIKDEKNHETLIKVLINPNEQYMKIKTENENLIPNYYQNKEINNNTLILNNNQKNNFIFYEAGEDTIENMNVRLNNETDKSLDNEFEFESE